MKDFIIKNRSAFLIFIGAVISGLLLGVAGYPVTIFATPFFVFFFGFSSEKLKSHVHLFSLIGAVFVIILLCEHIDGNLIWILKTFIIITAGSIIGSVLKRKVTYFAQILGVIVWGAIIFSAIVLFLLKYIPDSYLISAVSGIMSGIIGVPPAGFLCLLYTGSFDLVTLSVLTLAIISLPATLIKVAFETKMSLIDYRVVIYFLIGLFIGIFCGFKVLMMKNIITGILLLLPSLLLFVINFRNTVRKLEK